MHCYYSFNDAYQNGVTVLDCASKIGTFCVVIRLNSILEEVGFRLFRMGTCEGAERNFSASDLPT